MECRNNLFFPLQIRAVSFSKEKEDKKACSSIKAHKSAGKRKSMVLSLCTSQSVKERKSAEWQTDVFLELLTLTRGRAAKVMNFGGSSRPVPNPIMVI